MIEVSEVIVHEADEPDFVLDLFDADLLACAHGAQVDLPALAADSAARVISRRKDTRIFAVLDK